jgi:hypothetical protein
MAPAAALKKKQPDLRKVEAAPAMDDREALCAALAARFAAKDAVAAKLEALMRCRRGASDAEDTVERLEKAIAKAQEVDATRAAAAISAGRAVTGMPATAKAEHAVAEAKNVIEVSRAAKFKLEAELRVLQDGVAAAENLVTVAVAELMKPLVGRLIDDLRHARRACTVAVRVLGELFSDNPRLATFNDSLKSIQAQERREAVLGGLKTAEVDRLLFGPLPEDHAAAQQATAVVKKAMADLRASAATRLPDLKV